MSSRSPTPIRIQATELLLQERVPRGHPVGARPAESTTAPPSLPVFAADASVADTTTAHTHFLSNGRYTTAVTNTGGGFSMWRDVAVTRRRDDPTSDVAPIFIYLRDPWSSLWSATYELSVRSRPLRGHIRSRQDHVPAPRYRHRDAARDHCVVGRRRGCGVTITNRGAQTRDRGDQLREIVLARPEDDLAHPAFGKLFVETEFDPQAPPCSAAGRVRPMNHRSSAFTCSAWTVLASAVRSNGKQIGRASSAAGARPPPDRPRWPRVVGHHRRRARPDRRATRAHPAGARRRRPRGLPPESRWIAPPRWRWRESIATGAPLRAPSPWPSPTCTARCNTSGSATSTRCSSIGSPRVSLDPTRR